MQSYPVSHIACLTYGKQALPGLHALVLSTAHVGQSHGQDVQAHGDTADGDAGSLDEQVHAQGHKAQEVEA